MTTSLKTLTKERKGLDLVQHFFPGTGATYDNMVNLCTFGFDLWWKRKILEKIPVGSRRIMDQACGTGILTFKIARRFPQGEVVGVDVQEEYLDIAKRKARELGLKNVQFILGRAEDVYVERNFDCITSSYLSKYADLRSLIRNVKKMLHPGAILILHDFSYPSNHGFARIWEFYFRILQAMGRWKYPQWSKIFDGLPEVILETTWVKELISLLRENGFSDITQQSLTLGTSTIITARMT